MFGGKSMKSYMIPRNTKGEGRLLYIFSTKALIYTAVCGVIGYIIYWILSKIMLGTIGIILMAFLTLAGFLIGTLKVPNSQAFKITRIAGGENLDDIILRYIKFKRKKNKIYVTKEEEIVNE